MPAASRNLSNGPRPNSYQPENLVRRIFDQAQTTNANHRKNHVALYKLHTEFAAHKEVLNKGRSMKLTGERQFERIFHDSILRILPIKKGVTSADRIVKFVAGYIRFINEKALEGNTDESDDDDGGTTASRFTAKLLTLLLSGCLAKNKNVRYRVLQIFSEMISYLGQIDEDIYKALRSTLFDRLNDRESTIRSQAATSLAKLSASEDPEDLNGEPSILQTLLDSMAKDESADVRRAIILTIPITSQTLPGVLDRMQDIDATTRKIVYSKVLLVNISAEEVEMDGGLVGPTHPRELTGLQREQIVRAGLADRDLSVKSAAATLIAAWVDAVSARAEAPRAKIEEQLLESESPLLSFLSLFDLQEGIIAKEALFSVFDTRDKILDSIDFGADSYWPHLSPEKAFLARVFVEYCKVNQKHTKLEASMPVVTLIAFGIQEAYNLLDDPLPFPLTGEDLDRDARKKAANNQKICREIVISELLKLAVHLDYSDEMGRRKTLQLVCNMLRTESLPEILILPCLDVLRTLSATEGEFIRLVVEIIQDLREAISDEDRSEISKEDFGLEESFGELGPSVAEIMNQHSSLEQKSLADEVDLRCLSMCNGMLERVNGTLEKNITLEAVVNGLIFPSVLRDEPAFKERGVKALGLCSLIAKPLALKSIGFFINKISFATPSVKVALLHSAFDIFMVHEATMFRDSGFTLDTMTKFLIKNILEESDPNVKAVLCEGTAKLIFSGLITSIEALQALIKAFFSPLTVDNQKLRQSLAVFFGIYSHSSRENQKRLASVFIHVFLDICEDRKSARDATRDLDVVGSSRVIVTFEEWTDPIRLSRALKAADGAPQANAVDYCIQLEMAEDILKVLFEKDLKVDIEKNDRKMLCQLLNRLHIPDVVDDYRIRSLKLLMDTLKTRRPLRDSASKAAFTKFESTIIKKFNKQLEGFSEADYRKLEELNELFEFLDSVIPFDDEYANIDILKRGRKRRSESVISTTTESRSCSPRPREDKGKHMPKRARLSTSDEDFNGREDEDQAATATRRTLPKRAAVAKKRQATVSITSESEEQDSGAAARRGARLSNLEEDAEIDKQIVRLFISNTSSSNTSGVLHDSIMDTDSEEEEEVNDLLAAD